MQVLNFKLGIKFKYTIFTSNRTKILNKFKSCLNFFRKNDYIDRELCLPFYALFCLFSPFPQLHSPLCAFEK